MITAFFPVAISAAEIPLRNAEECSPRGGLPNFFAKLEKGDNVKIAYFGGSITDQAGWRVQSLVHLQKMYPKVKFSGINAALGGTGSMLGVFRMDNDVLQYNPDLIFIEFSVNDEATGGPERDIVCAMEGIVRKTWKQYPNCDICFIYTVTTSCGIFEKLRNGKMCNAASVMEQVADYYAIPSIHMAIEVARLEKAGKLQMKAPDAQVTQVSGKELDMVSPVRVTADGKIPFAPEGVHPYLDTGHRLYTEAIIRSLPTIKASASKPRLHILPAPIDSSNLENTVMLPVDHGQVKMAGPWNKLSDGEIKNNMHESFGNRVPSLWRGELGAELSFRFKGSRAMIYDIMGPGCGKLEITIDGKTLIVVRMDGYCTYNRLTTLDIAKDLDIQKIHEVKIKVLDDKLDKGKILLDYNRNDFKNNPGKYTGSNWYAGAIFLVGELVK